MVLLFLSVKLFGQGPHFNLRGEEVCECKCTCTTIDGSVKYSTIVDIFPSKKGRKSERVMLFYPIVITMGKNSEGHTVLPLLDEGKEQ